MRPTAHIRLLSLGALAWLVFWIGGLPDYYQQYSFSAMLVFSVVLVVAIGALARRVLGRVKPARRKALGYWLSFYFTVPLMLFDYVYCGMYLGHGWHFLAGYWYLTAFYIVPWLILVPTAYFLSRPHGRVKYPTLNPAVKRPLRMKRGEA